MKLPVRILASVFFAWMVATFALLIPELVEWIYVQFDRFSRVRSGWHSGLGLHDVALAGRGGLVISVIVCLVVLLLFSLPASRALRGRPARSGLAGGSAGVLLTPLWMSPFMSFLYRGTGFFMPRGGFSTPDFDSMVNLATALSAAVLSGMAYGFCHAYLARLERAAHEAPDAGIAELPATGRGGGEP